MKAKLKVLLAIPHTIAVMMAGGVVYLIAYAFNLREFSNSFSWWLNMNPPELLFYAVLPILLFDAAMRINWFHFRRSVSPSTMNEAVSEGLGGTLIWLGETERTNLEASS